MTPWGVGSYEGPGGREPWEISHEEIQRDMGTASKTLAELGVGPGQRVLFCSMLSEAGQFWPLIVGAMLSGAQLSCADATESEAVRVAMFTRLIEYRAVLGVTPAILDGLDALGHPYADVFAGIEVIGARPGAYERLRAAGLSPRRFVLCGPAVAIADAPDAPALVSASEWEIAGDGDRVVVTGRRERATTFERTHTAVRGDVVGNGVVWRT
ncbi:MAG: hypothetical protein SGJ13_17230 [Actinomycetota bacterium]|nr:hypothetical protein [Actinomycetota bacterium]